MARGVQHFAHERNQKDGFERIVSLGDSLISRTNQALFHLEC